MDKKPVKKARSLTKARPSQKARPAPVQTPGKLAGKAGATGIEVLLFSGLLHLSKKGRQPHTVAQQRALQERLCKLIPQPDNIYCENKQITHLPARWLYPSGGHKNNLILYFHGGAYVAGSERSASALGAKLAQSTGVGVLALGYRLAPEHPYPAALNDALTAYTELLAAGISPKRIAVAGESAGGGLALALVLRLKADNLPLPACLAALSPWTDLTMKSGSANNLADADPVLIAGQLKESARAYAGGQSLKNPYISPLFGNYKQFVPTLLQVGENELLLDDTLTLGRKLEQAQVPFTLECYPGMWHVFQAYGLPQSEQALQEVGTFVRRWLPEE